MKIFQIVNNICYYDATPVHPTLESTVDRYPPDVLFVEAPDIVREGWGYDPTETGDARFIRPTPPEGWQYDDETGTFYQGKLYDPYRERKIAECNDACARAIVKGCDVTLEDGTVEHFALTAEDQINIATAEKAVRAGATQFPYHADGKLCRLYDAKDIMNIINTATAWKTYHTTYFNHLKQWINRTEEKADILAIHYGDELPEDLKQSLDAIMAAMNALINSGATAS